jgi:hypothetical protein
MVFNKRILFFINKVYNIGQYYKKTHNGRVERIISAEKSKNEDNNKTQ